MSLERAGWGRERALCTLYVRACTTCPCVRTHVQHTCQVLPFSRTFTDTMKTTGVVGLEILFFTHLSHSMSLYVNSLTDTFVKLP